MLDNARPKIICLAIMGTLIISCGKKEEEVAAENGSSENSSSQSTQRYLYFSSGLCRTGSGVTSFTAATSSNLIVKVNLSTGQREAIVADYSSFPASSGDTPVGLIDWDANNLAVTVGNGTSGRIELVPKNGGTRSNFGLNPGPSTVFSATPRYMGKAADSTGFFTIKSGSIDKISNNGIRQSGPSASTNYVMNNLGATCGATNTLYNFAVQSPSGKIISGHAVASANRLVSLSSSGASSATQCLATQAAPGAGTAWPMDAVYDSANNKLIVAWANSATTANSNMIVIYDYDDSTGAFGTSYTVYDASTTSGYVLFNIASMAYDSTKKILYVATAISTATTVVNYAIEKFSYDPTQIGIDNTKVLTRVGSSPFYSYGIDTKCISSMMIGY